MASLERMGNRGATTPKYVNLALRAEAGPEPGAIVAGQRRKLRGGGRVSVQVRGEGRVAILRRRGLNGIVLLI